MRTGYVSQKPEMTELHDGTGWRPRGKFASSKQAWEIFVIVAEYLLIQHTSKSPLQLPTPTPAPNPDHSITSFTGHVLKPETTKRNHRNERNDRNKRNDRNEQNY